MKMDDISAVPNAARTSHAPAACKPKKQVHGKCKHKKWYKHYHAISFLDKHEISPLNIHIHTPYMFTHYPSKFILLATYNSLSLD